MKKIMSKKLNILFVIAVLAVSLVGIIGFAGTANACDYYDYDCVYDYSYDDYCYDCYDYSYDYSYDNYCYDCYDYSTDYCNDCNYTPPAPTLSVSCAPNVSTVYVNESMTWIANAYGGNGSYTYTWSGGNTAAFNTRKVQKSYEHPGIRNDVTVTVRSGNQTKTARCSSLNVIERPIIIDNPLVGSCSVSDNNININDSVTWSANVSGGTGNYTYDWSGSYPLLGNTRTVNTQYTSSGAKTGNVIVRSGNKTLNLNCGTVVVEDNNNDNDNFDVSCDVSDTSVESGDDVTFRAVVNGGNSPFTYDWSGDVDGSSRTVTERFYNEGTYHAQVRVRDNNGNSQTAYCSTVRVNEDENDNDNLQISCNVNTTQANIGQSVYWNTSVSGGNGNYRYSWSGTDGLYGSNSSISKTYSNIGTKTARVTVISSGNSKSLECPTVVIGGGNVVLYQGPNQGNLASLSSVYLNQVPYTGVGDNPKFWGFVIGLILFSAFAAYATVRYRNKTARKNAIVNFKELNKNKLA